MVYKISSPLAGAQKITEASPTKRHDFGTIVTGSDPVAGAGEFIYSQLPVSAFAGDVAQYKNGGVATAGAPTADGPVGVVMAATPATPVQYGWLQITGRAVTKWTGGAFTVGAPAYLGAAGAAISAVTATDQIFNAYAASVGSAGFVNLDLNRPWVA